MEWVRSQTSPWGQEILTGLSWDTLWVAVWLGAAVIVGHFLLRWLVLGRLEKAAVGGGGAKSLPARILRHTVPSRLFHWTMAVSMLVLLGTAFLPILGWKFPWVTIHWVAGWVLIAAVLFHMVHTTFFKGLRLMWISMRDLKARWELVRQMTGAQDAKPAKPGKIPLDNKLFHHGAALAAGAAILTGILMMVKVDTPWWNRNPYVLSDGTWGIVYVIHGAGGVALVMLVMVHIYFALRPDKFWITLSMFRGWISREKYLEHHDPERWPPAAAPGNKAPSGAGAGQ